MHSNQTIWKYLSLSAFVALLATLSISSNALAILLQKPIDCQIGQDCFIQNYVDLGPDTTYCDAFGGALSYDKHKGTDFRVPFANMQAGVAIKSAAPGVVRGVRDGMEDIRIRQGGEEIIKGRECGNGVVILSPDGTETQYCHMRKGSLRVKAGLPRAPSWTVHHS